MNLQYPVAVLCRHADMKSRTNLSPRSRQGNHILWVTRDRLGAVSGHRAIVIFANSSAAIVGLFFTLLMA